MSSQGSDAFENYSVENKIKFEVKQENVPFSHVEIDFKF